MTSTALERKKTAILEYYRGGKVADYENHSESLTRSLKNKGYLRSGISLDEMAETIRTTELGLAHLASDRKW
ncbi:MAG: hypothetical protein LBG62_00260 [Candidatus Methanoplasma sp.]|jgi:hypothetical protein|nr:hypothetical protein [Candidatus Methanoplasma sp.]